MPKVTDYLSQINTSTIEEHQKKPILVHLRKYLAQESKVESFKISFTIVSITCLVTAILLSFVINKEIKNNIVPFAHYIIFLIGTGNILVIFFRNKLKKIPIIIGSVFFILLIYSLFYKLPEFNHVLIILTKVYFVLSFVSPIIIFHIFTINFIRKKFKEAINTYSSKDPEEIF